MKGFIEVIEALSELDVEKKHLINISSIAMVEPAWEHDFVVIRHCTIHLKDAHYKTLSVRNTYDEILNLISGAEK